MAQALASGTATGLKLMASTPAQSLNVPGRMATLVMWAAPKLSTNWAAPLPDTEPGKVPPS
jgi:hypothetical protein